MKIKDIRKEYFGRFRKMEIYVLTKNIPTFAHGYRELITFDEEDLPILDELNSEFYLNVDAGGYNSTVMVGTDTTIEKEIHPDELKFHFPCLLIGISPEEYEKFTSSKK